MSYSQKLVRRQETLQVIVPEPKLEVRDVDKKFSSSGVASQTAWTVRVTGISVGIMSPVLLACRASLT